MSSDTAPTQSRVGRTPDRMAGRQEGAVRIVFAVALAGLILAVFLGALLSRQMRPAGSVRLATFYRPLTQGPPTAELAERLGLAILTRTDEAYRDALRDAGFEGPILQYLLANQASGPPGLTDARSPCHAYPQYTNNASGISGDFCSALHGDERNFLHNGRGERLYSTQAWEEGGSTRRVYLYLMNPGAAGWRRYLAARTHLEIASQGYSGIFLDNLDLSLHRGRHQAANADGVVTEYASDEQYRTAGAGLLQEIRQEIGTAPLWANLTNATDGPSGWDSYVSRLDGVMEESFVAGWEGKLADSATWETQLRQAEAVLRSGKGLLAVAQGERNDVSRMRFALASFLLITEEGASFRYADGSGGEDTSPEYYQLWTYAEYGIALGEPRGSRYRVGDTWRRDFACGSVTVQVAERRGVIEAEPNCHTSFMQGMWQLTGMKLRAKG